MGDLEIRAWVAAMVRAGQRPTAQDLLLLAMRSEDPNLPDWISAQVDRHFRPFTGVPLE